MRAPQDYGQLATDLAAMARDLVSQDTVQATLDSIVNHAVTLVEGCDAAAIMTIRKDDSVTLAGTGPVIGVADRMQVGRQQSPWFDAAGRDSRMYRIEDTCAADLPWPGFAELARASGVGSMMGFLLYIHGEHDVAGLELYGGSPGAFDERSEHVGWVLASHAAVALSSARHAENTDRALESSRTIGEAIGVIMSRYELDEQAAFEAIRRTSQDQNIKVRDLADKITATGELPQ